ncbi:hypothetical protein DVH24_028721 [Malus domestica]|uniref:Alpha/beta hydrolase fold-3 domain-containing protein n=1 Tax=Malus domestica TaxID=3750 RepID=A0A498J125_MALDO|nr:hypothetical protein DVH24_028721 [Malus domestica]
MLQFHGGGWVNRSTDSVANDIFCMRITKLCEVVILAVGYHFGSELGSEGRRKGGCELGETGFGGERRLGEAGFGGWNELGGGFGGEGAGCRGKKEGRGLGEVEDG